MTVFRQGDRVNRGYPRVHQYAGIAIARHHALRTPITMILKLVELEHRPHRFIPSLASPDIEIPVQVEIFEIGRAHV